jgi:biopolymer transport protein ExbB/TolQ
METALPGVTGEPTLNITIYDLVLNADIVVQGVMALLVLASAICWAIILEKLVRLSAFGAQVRRLERFTSDPAGQPGSRAWLAHSLHSAATWHGDPAPGESRSEIEARLEKAMRYVARAELARLRPRLRFLATVGSTGPFVGLFGTVWGIMNSFTAIAAQKDTSLAVVGPGIAEALFATALGLVAAIPAVIAYNQITGSISRFAERIQFAIAALTSSFSRSALKNRMED